MGNAQRRFVKRMCRNVGKEACVTARRPFTLRVLITLAVLLAPLVAASLTGCQASCKPMEINGVNMNCSGGATGYMWTGSSCIYTHACNCTGADCQRLYPNQDACENAHLHCAPGSK
jgi:hypothetical protein